MQLFVNKSDRSIENKRIQQQIGHWSTARSRIEGSASPYSWNTEGLDHRGEKGSSKSATKLPQTGADSVIQRQVLFGEHQRRENKCGRPWPAQREEEGQMIYDKKAELPRAIQDT